MPAIPAGLFTIQGDHAAIGKETAADVEPRHAVENLTERGAAKSLYFIMRNDRHHAWHVGEFSGKLRGGGDLFRRAT